jgi:hypothetical protein
MLPNYEIVAPPFFLDFSQMSRAELKAYYAWFLAEIPSRMRILQAAVRDTAGFRSWRANETVASLDKLGRWFAKVTTSRPRTEEEINAIKAQCTTIPFEDLGVGPELTDETFSLAFDIGMYFGRVMLTNHRSLVWTQELRRKGSIDYGLAVIAGFKSNARLNPVWAMQVAANGFVAKVKGPDDIVRLYHVWAGSVPVPG